MTDEVNSQPAADNDTSTRASDRPPERLVRHVFWKYPILSVVLLVVVATVAFAVGSPNWPRDTIASVTRANPGGAILAFTQELDGTATSSGNAAEYGMGDPGQVFVLGPLRQVAPLWRADFRAALATYDAATPQQELAWAKAYDDALGTITPMSSGDMGGTSGPDYMKIGTLKGDFGPVPVIVQADLLLAQNGFLEQYLQAVDPGHSFHLVNIWLYDHPNLLNTAVAQGLTDDQWGMVKERGFSVGPWYLFIPAVFHVYFPNGADGTWFVLWNLLFAAILMFVVPLVPGVRDIPKYLKLYRFIYRYPLSGELAKPALVERHGATHGGTEVEVAAAGGGE
jgi:hypothetical protein